MTAAFRVRVPASSANLGPGFDCLGLALGLYHELAVETVAGTEPGASTSPDVRIQLEGEGAGELSRGSDNLVIRALLEVLASYDHKSPDLRLTSCNRVPLARGLGSSAAAYLAGAAAGQWLCSGQADKDWLLDRGRRHEGHADNVAPCLMGGITVVSGHGDRLQWLRLDPPADLRAVLAVPAFELSTAHARQVLPQSLMFASAVQAGNRACLLTAALALNRFDLLGAAMEDEWLHEPWREPLVPGLQQVRGAARDAGAWGACLSGAGPSVLALTPVAAAADVAAAMTSAWRRDNVTCTCLQLPVDGEGLQVVPNAEEDN